MFLGAAGLVEEVLEFVDFGVKTVVQSKASLVAVIVLKRVIAAKRKDQKVCQIFKICAKIQGSADCS